MIVNYHYCITHLIAGVQGCRIVLDIDYAVIYCILWDLGSTASDMSWSVKDDLDLDRQAIRTHLVLTDHKDTITIPAVTTLLAWVVYQSHAMLTLIAVVYAIPQL